MNAYIYRAALYCEDCAYRIMNGLDETAKDAGYDSERYPIGPSPNGGGKADTPQHCDSCGVFLENPLTNDGLTYVEDAVTRFDHDASGDADVINEWRTSYADALFRSTPTHLVR